jgi:hypothetical protein
MMVPRVETGLKPWTEGYSPFGAAPSGHKTSELYLKAFTPSFRSGMRHGVRRKTNPTTAISSRNAFFLQFSRTRILR